MRFLIAVLLHLLVITPALAECAGKTLTRNVHAAPVCIPSNPQRIVILDPFYNLGMSMELGLPVVGAPLFGLHDPELKVRAINASIADIGDPKQPGLERIVSLKPDLIIGLASFHGSTYEALSGIAPTLLINDLNWQEHFRLLAETTGRGAAAEEALSAYEKRVANIRQRVNGKTVSVVRITASGFLVYPDGPTTSGPFAVLREAGVKRTPYETVTDDTRIKRPDWEDLAALQGTTLLYFVAGGYDPEKYAEFEAATVGNPLWKMLPSVEAGRAYRVDAAHWMGFNGVTSAHKVLDDIERYILADR